VAGRYTFSPAAKAGINAANSVMWLLRPPATCRPRIREIGISVVVAPTTAPNFVLARSTGIGVTPVSVAALPDDPADPAATVLADTSWGTQPTFTTAGPFLRQVALAAAAGSGIIWTFPDAGLILPAGTGATSGLVIANTVASGATLGSFALYVVWDE
jgi:hypothetical protein